MEKISGSQMNEFIVYADESGDHNLENMDKYYPIFSLSLCLFDCQNYINRIVPRFQLLKFNYFGHDNVIFHERDIRKQQHDFTFLTNERERHKFKSDIQNAIQSSRFKIAASVIDKRAMRYNLVPENPYVVSLRICIERIFEYTGRIGRKEAEIKFVFEKRGKREDRELEAEFYKIRSGENRFRHPFPNYDICFADKRSNTTGMQIADMTARPIGLRVLRPNQSNSAFTAFRSKLIRAQSDTRGFPGLYVFK